MQRLLRSRLFYLVLGLLIVLLYSWTIWLGSPRGPKSGAHEVQQQVPALSPAQSPAPDTWWPEGLDAERVRQVVTRQPMLGLILSLLSLFVVGMGLGGLAYSCWALATGRVRSFWSASSRRALPRWSFGELGRLLLLAVMMASLLPFVRIALLSHQYDWSLDTHLWMTISMLFLDLFVVLAILAFAAGKGTTLRKVFGFSGKRLRQSVGAGFRAYLMAFPWLFVLLFIIVTVAQTLGLKPPVEPIHELILGESRPAVLALTAALACVIGPLAEEFLFRGVLYPAIRQRSSRLVAMLISGAVFSFIHTNLLGFLPIMVLGCLLADLYERTGSLAGPLFVHALHNTLLISLALVFRQLAAQG